MSDFAEPPVLVYRVAHLALALAGVRLGFGLVGFAAALAAGAPLRSGAVGFAVGLGGGLVALVSSQRWALVEQPEVEPLPARVDTQGALGRALLTRLMPSTAGVAALLAISPAFEPILAAVLAGVLAGMGGISLASGVDVLVWEHRARRSLFADGTRRRYAGSPDGRIRSLAT